MANYNSGHLDTYSGNAEAQTGPTYVKDTAAPLDLMPVVNAYLREQKARAGERDGVRSVQSEIDYQAALMNKQNELDPTSPTYIKDIQEWSASQRKMTVDGAALETPEARADLDKRLLRFGGQTVLTAIGQQQKATEAKAVTVRADIENAVLNGIRNNPENADALMQDYQSKVSRMNTGVPLVTQEKMSRDFADNAVLAQTEGMALKGDVGGARDYLKGAMGLAPDTVRAMSRRLNEIENQNEQKISAGMTAQYAQVYDDVNSGSISSLGQLDNPAYAALWEARPMARVQLREQLRNKQEQQVRESRAERDHARSVAIGNGGGYSAGDSDKAWATGQLDNPPQNPTEYMTRLFDHVQAYTMVPTAVKQSFDRAEYSNDPTELATQGMVEQALHEQFPNANTGASKIYSEMRTFRDLYGADYDQAANLALRNRNTDPNVKERRKIEFTQVSQSEKYQPRAALGEFLGATPDQLPPELVQHFDELTRDIYTTSGDINYAKKAAGDIVRNRYKPGTTTVGGVERTVPFPPESRIANDIPNAKAYIPLLGDAITGYLTTSLKGKIQPYSPEAGKEWETVEGQPPVRLQATPLTEKQIKDNSPPTYEVQQRIPGGYAPVRDANGAPVTYTIPNWDELKTYPGIKEKVAKDTQTMVQQANIEKIKKEMKTQVLEGGAPGAIPTNPVMDKGGTLGDVRSKLRDSWGIK